jgi:hypothetical protein
MVSSVHSLWKSEQACARCVAHLTQSSFHCVLHIEPRMSIIFASMGLQIHNKYPAGENELGVHALHRKQSDATLNL